MGENTGQQNSSGLAKSVIEAFGLKDLPTGIKHDITAIETRGKGKLCDGDIEDIYTLTRQGFGMSGKPMPACATHKAVREFYKQ